MPSECGSDGQREALVDCFFLHPTSYMAFKDDDRDNCAIDDLQANLLVEFGQLPQQASAFNVSLGSAPDVGQTTIH